MCSQKILCKIAKKFRSLLEGAVERSETEGVKKIISIIKLPQSFFLRKMTAPSEMGRKYKLNCISNGVGRWLAAAKRISENKTAFGCCQIEFNVNP